MKVTNRDYRQSRICPRSNQHPEKKRSTHMQRSILVPLDGSAFGEHALPLAISMARRLHASLNLIHVHSLLDATYAEIQVFDNTLDQELHNAEREYLRSIQKKVQGRLSVAVTIHNVDG